MVNKQHPSNGEVAITGSEQFIVRKREIFYTEEYRISCPTINIVPKVILVLDYNNFELFKCLFFDNLLELKPVNFIKKHLI